jgi:protein-tyrosine phosphatase
MSQAPSTTPGAHLAPTHAGTSRAAELLAAGRLVVLPTETIYGIALNLLSPEARTAAHQLRHPADAASIPPHWVIHVASPEEALGWAPHLSSLGRRLITKALPGPVSFQIKLTPDDAADAKARLGDAAPQVLVDGFITIRCPDFPATQEVLSSAKVPVAIVGAGKSGGGPGVFEVADMPDTLARSVAGAMDGGPTRYRKSSTLVRLDADGPGTFSVVRPGVIDERIIQRMADLVVLFVCSGNTCRSPMAAALATKILADKLHIRPDELPLRHLVVQSAGVHAQRGMRAAREAVDTVKSLGADLSSHFSQPAGLDVLRRADVIYTMTDAHRDEILRVYPGGMHKTFRIDPEGDVPDPIGAGLQAYREVAQRLTELLKDRLNELPL